MPGGRLRRPSTTGAWRSSLTRCLTLALTLTLTLTLALTLVLTLTLTLIITSTLTRRVALFTEQLVEANPVLTDISDCMTAEGRALDAGDAAAAGEWRQRKEEANVALKDCSEKYNGLMASLRETGW